jgi:secreted PhoX family phosphatase
LPHDDEGLHVTADLRGADAPLPPGIEDPDDLSANPSDARSFAEVVATRLSRRTVLTGSLVAAAGFMAPRLLPSGTATADDAMLLGFSAIPMSTADEVVVPPGYTAAPLIPWGTPILGSMPAFRPGTPGAPDGPATGGNTAEEQAEQIGMHHDGMHFFALGNPERARQRGLLVVNHEYTAEDYLHTGAFQPRVDGVSWTARRRSAWTAEMVRKSQNAHGVSVVAVRKRADNGAWEPVASEYNRRVTARTPMVFSGPATGHRLLRTTADAAGQSPIGTVNNCSHGYTPWGTYLACEENFNGYFRLTTALTSFPAESQAMLRRYGGFSDSNYNWSTHDQRWSVSPEEPSRAEPLRLGRRDRPLPADVDAGQADGARTDEARGRARARHHGRRRGRLHGRRPGPRLRLQVRQRRLLARHAGSRRQPARRGHALRRALRRRRHRPVAPAGARPGSR